MDKAGEKIGPLAPLLYINPLRNKRKRKKEDVYMFCTKKKEKKADANCQKVSGSSLHFS
jgi:hypothetical protein